MAAARIADDGRAGWLAQRFRQMHRGARALDTKSLFRRFSACCAPLSRFLPCSHLPPCPPKQALKWAKRAVDEEAQIGLRVSNVLLFPKAAQSLANSTGSRKVAVRIALPAALSETLAADLAATDPTAPWITPAARLVGGKITYDTDLPNADAHAGSAVHAALLALMDAASSARLSGEVEVEAAASEVLVQIVLLGEAAAGKAASSAGKQSRSASAADKEKILGVARFSLTDMLEGGQDLEAGAPLSLWASRPRRSLRRTRHPPPLRPRKRRQGGQAAATAIARPRPPGSLASWPSRRKWRMRSRLSAGSCARAGRLTSAVPRHEWATATLLARLPRPRHRRAVAHSLRRAAGREPGGRAPR